MNKFILGLLLLGSATGSLSSCKRNESIPAPVADTVPVAFPQPSSDPSKQFYNFASARASVASNPTRPVFEFTLAPASNANNQLESILVYKSFLRGGVLGARVLVGEYTSFPATISINSQEALTGITRNGGTPVIASASNPAQNNLLLNQDAILFTFDYKNTNGQVFTITPIDATGSVIATSMFARPPYAIAAVFRAP